MHDIGKMGVPDGILLKPDLLTEEEWDALHSDHPYRAAWPEGKVREHIRALSGIHFDPQVVDVFM